MSQLYLVSTHKFLLDDVIGYDRDQVSRPSQLFHLLGKTSPPNRIREFSHFGPISYLLIPNENDVMNSQIGQTSIGC